MGVRPRARGRAGQHSNGNGGGDAGYYGRSGCRCQCIGFQGKRSALVQRDFYARPLADVCNFKWEDPMSNKTVFTREQLYELVWSKPVSRLAPEYGLSGVTISKTCRKHDIPLCRQNCPPHQRRKPNDGHRQAHTPD